MRRSFWFCQAIALVGLSAAYWLNEFVIQVNGGCMPVMLPAIYQLLPIPAFIDSKHVAMTAATQYPYLADIIPCGLIGVCSVGDIIGILGFVPLATHVIKAIRDKRWNSGSRS